MSFAVTKKKLLRALGRNAFFISRRIISFLPYPVFRFLIVIFMPVSRILIGNRKRVAMENLHTAFGAEKNEAEIRRIASRCFDNLAVGMIELIYFLEHPETIAPKVEIEGREHLDKALAQGQGAILLSAHLGNFILMYLRMPLAGYKTNCIMRRLRDEKFEKVVSQLRDQNGIQTIYSLPHRQCVVNSLKSLRNNETLFILLDQNYGEDGRVFVDFFGKPAATATGPVVFSQRAGSPILPTFIVREKKDFYKIIIEPPVQLRSGQGQEEGLVENVAYLTKIIEGHIRRHPHEWGGWLHRRWKSKKAIA